MLPFMYYYGNPHAGLQSIAEPSDPENPELVQANERSQTNVNKELNGINAFENTDLGFSAARDN